METGNRVRALGYVRVSTENQLENYSIDEQVKRIEGFCLAKGWELLKIYTDGGFSGGNTRRPALGELLEAVRTRRADAVVVYKLDRLSRSQKDTLVLIEDEFLAHGTDFISINESFDTSAPFGRAMIGILSVFAQLEKDQIAERFTMGRIGRSRAGLYHGGGNPPTGYDYVGGRLLINEFQASQVREAYRRFLAGESLHAIAKSLAERFGGSWSAAKVRCVLKNSVYAGKVKFAGEEYQGKHEPLVSPEVFQAVQRLLPDGVRSRESPEKSPFRAQTLLSGLVFCARCGARYCGNHGFYKCYSRSKCCAKYVRDPACRNKNWPVRALDEAVLRSLWRLTENPALREAVLASARWERPRTEGPEACLKRIDVQLERLVGLCQAGEAPLEEAVRRVRALTAQREALACQAEEKSPPEKGFREGYGPFREGWDVLPLESRRFIISSLIREIRIDGDAVEIRWRV